MNKNGIITGNSTIEALFKVGFSHLGSNSPMNNEENIIVSRALSIDECSVVWFAYELDRNADHIKPKEGEDGRFDIHPFAKSLVTLSMREGFLDFNAGNTSFNSLAAVEKYKELLHDSSFTVIGANCEGFITTEQAKSLGFTQHEKKGNCYTMECDDCYLTLFFHRNDPIYLHITDGAYGCEDNGLNVFTRRNCTYDRVKNVCKALSLDD